ncbi:hypothetical protein C4J81_00115 [Deltaproteobacteria bacterium Smac51]|nr:hypothetical protein C4J81_00115 [Deltaproteobacteria bacterium Smac51]
MDFKGKGELHLMIIWNTARHREEEILADLKSKVKVIECYDIYWSAKKIGENFGRFYGVKLTDVKNKIKECGRGPFLLITVWDENPEYGLVETSRGTETVNLNLFSLKSRYREWSGGGSRIHATNNPYEADRDFTLMLGRSAKDYLERIKKQGLTSNNKLEQDIIGAHGWENLNELFYVLNHTTNYLVLRNFENLFKPGAPSDHGDIDLLVESGDDTALILNARKVFPDEHRVHYSTIVDDEEVLFDLRFVGDDYYCRQWESDLLNNRIFQDGLYVPRPEDYFYSLVYHALIHKKSIADDYHLKTARLARDLKILDAETIESADFDLYFELLCDYMWAHHYQFVRPHDVSVFFKKQLAESWVVIKYLSRYPLSDIKAALTFRRASSNSNYSYFTAKHNGRKIFIKWGGLGDCCRREASSSKLLFSINNNNFLNPLFYHYEKDRNFLALPFLEGESLLSKAATLTRAEKEAVILQLKDIAETLIKARLLHRDINPENLILTDDQRLYLIDPQYAINLEKKYRELKAVKAHPHLIIGLGAGYGPGSYKWDDMVSLSNILNWITGTDKNYESYSEVADYLNGLKGKYHIDGRRKLKLLKSRRRLKVSLGKRMRKIGKWFLNAADRLIS